MTAQNAKWFVPTAAAAALLLALGLSYAFHGNHGIDAAKSRIAQADQNAIPGSAGPAQSEPDRPTPAPPQVAALGGNGGAQQVDAPVNLIATHEEIVATSELIVRGHILGPLEKSPYRYLYGYLVSEVVYGDVEESQLVGKEIRVALSRSEAGPVGEDSLLFIVSADQTKKGTVYDAQKYQWLEGNGWPEGSWQKLMAPTIDVIREGRHLLFPPTEKLAYFWSWEPRRSIMGRCLFVRARLAGVDKTGSRWEVTSLIKGESAPKVIVIPHDEFRRRAETVVRDRYRTAGKERPGAADFKAQVDQVAAKMIQAELPAKAVGAEAILAVDKCNAQEAGMQCRLRKCAFEDDSGKALDTLEKSIRHWMEADRHEVIRATERS